VDLAAGVVCSATAASATSTSTAASLATSIVWFSFGIMDVVKSLLGTNIELTSFTVLLLVGRLAIEDIASLLQLVRVKLPLQRRLDRHQLVDQVDKHGSTCWWQVVILIIA